MPEHDDRALFELLTLEGAQAGLSWSTILRKRDAYREAFANFDVARVARFTPARVEKAAGNAGIVRNRLKIESTITNARALSACREGGRIVRPVRVAIRRREHLWSTTRQRTAKFRREHTESDALSARPQEARVPLCRIDDLLRLHAGGRNGERSHRRLLSLSRSYRAKWPCPPEKRPP